jgi:hypothetical protein
MNGGEKHSLGNLEEIIKTSCTQKNTDEPGIDRNNT